MVALGGEADPFGGAVDRRKTQFDMLDAGRHVGNCFIVAPVRQNGVEPVLQVGHLLGRENKSWLLVGPHNRGREKQKADKVGRAGDGDGFVEAEMLDRVYFEWELRRFHQRLTPSGSNPVVRGEIQYSKRAIF